MSMTNYHKEYRTTLGMERKTIQEALSAVSKDFGLWVMWGTGQRNMKLGGGMKGLLDYANGNKYGEEVEAVEVDAATVYLKRG